MEVTARYSLNRHSASVPRARHIVEGLLDSCGSDHRGGDLVLAISELCTNVVQHATGPTYTLEVSLQGHHVTFRVADHGTDARSDGWLPSDPPRMPDIGSLRGRGLAIVEALVDELEIECGHDGSWTVVVHHDLQANAYATSA